MIFAKTKPILSEQELINIAKLACEKEHWPWQEPVHIQDKLLRWVVLTNSLAAGRNVEIVVSKKTGEVIRKTFCGR